MLNSKAEKSFFVVYDEIRSLVEIAKKNFNDLIAGDKKLDKVPRYFQMVFLTKKCDKNHTKRKQIASLFSFLIFNFNHLMNVNLGNVEIRSAVGTFKIKLFA